MNGVIGINTEIFTFHPTYIYILIMSKSLMPNLPIFEIKDIINLCRQIYPILEIKDSINHCRQIYPIFEIKDTINHCRQIYPIFEIKDTINHCRQIYLTDY